jgi:hypothetical protein
MCTSRAELAAWRGDISLTLGVRGAEAKLQKEHTFGHSETPSKTPVDSATCGAPRWRAGHVCIGEFFLRPVPGLRWWFELCCLYLFSGYYEISLEGIHEEVDGMFPAAVAGGVGICGRRK